MSQELQTQVSAGVPMEFSASEVKRQVHLIQEVMRDVMKKDEHFGIIPGCKKPSLYKPGAEKLSFVFRLAPEFRVERNDLQRMLDQARQMARTGARDAAREMLQRLQEMLENMRAQAQQQPGEGGEQGGEGQQMLQSLQEMMQRQQNLADRNFRRSQQNRPGQGRPGQPNMGGRQPGQFYGVHSIATDSKGNLYTTETYEGKRLQKFVYKGMGMVAPSQGTVWPSR